MCVSLLQFVSDQQAERQPEENPDFAAGTWLSKASGTPQCIGHCRGSSRYWKHPMAQIFIPCSVLKLLWFLLLIVLLLFPVSAKQGNVHRLCEA